MTAINGTTVARTGVPTAEATGSSVTARVRQLGHADGFEVTSKGRTAEVPTASTGGVRITPGTAAVQADVVDHTVAGLNAVRDSFASSGKMSHDQAKAAVIGIYSAAFPGIGFTEYELGKAIKMLESGKVTPAELQERVNEGARLINDPNAMANEAVGKAMAEEHFTGTPEQYMAGRPYFLSVITQQLRMERLSQLMGEGYLPEGKFNVVGGFSYGTAENLWTAPGAHMDKLFDGEGTGGSADLSGGHRITDPVQAKRDALESQLKSLEELERANEKDDIHQKQTLSRGALSRDMAKSLENYRSTNKSSGSEVDGRGEDGKTNPLKQKMASLRSQIAKLKAPLTQGQRIGSPQLISGANSNTAAPAASTSAFGWDTNNQVSLQGATSSSLLAASKELMTAKKTGSPVMLDLNHDGKLGTTGNSTAKDRKADDWVVNDAVDFDLDGNGTKERIEWMKGDGDGMLVDDHDGGATAAMNGNGEIDGKRLFGDEGGKFANGYDKLKAYDANNDGQLTGHELDGLKTWIDNGDAKIQQGELKTLAELGVSSINLKMELTANDKGEQMMRSTFTQNGQQYVSEDVWFGINHELPNLANTADMVAGQADHHERQHMVQRLDSTLALADNVARDLEQRHSVSRLGDHAHTLLAHQGFRA